MEISGMRVYGACRWFCLLFLFVLSLCLERGNFWQHRWAIHGLERPLQFEKIEKQSGSCNTFGPPTLQWGYNEACHIVDGDETCEMFMASDMYCNETTFIETASRAADSSYKPSLVRLKTRIVEAVLENRALKILAMGPSTTFGKGCPLKHLRWSDALQNLSNFTGSPLPMEVRNAAAGATELRTALHFVLDQYKDAGDFAVDLLVIDYAVSSRDMNLETTMLLDALVQRWKRPPAILFVELFPSEFTDQGRADACNFSSNFDSESAFYISAKKLKFPLLSYPDIACHLPGLNRTSRSSNGAPFLYVYPEENRKHYGCGVHMILAHTIQLYLNKLLRDSCNANAEQKQSRCVQNLKDFCAAGFRSTLESLKVSKLHVDVAKLSQEARCEINLLDSWSFYAGHQFPALASTDSNWHVGADRPGKFGWIANEEPMIPLQQTMPWASTEDPNITKNLAHFLKLKLTKEDIIFFVRLSLGIVFVDILGSYENIGSADCHIEDLKGNAISKTYHFTGLWLRKSRKISIGTRKTMYAKQVPKIVPFKGPNAAVRCHDKKKKFKFIAISSC